MSAICDHSFFKRVIKTTVSSLLLLGMIVMGFSEGLTESGKETHSATSEKSESVMEKTWGIRPLNVRLTASDHFLDFRYRILDPDKAAMLTKRDKKAYLIDQASGKRVTVPVTKLGPLRGTDVKPKKDRVYVVLFSNTDNTVKKGSKVTIVIGDFRAENLVVE